MTTDKGNEYKRLYKSDEKVGLLKEHNENERKKITQ